MMVFKHEAWSHEEGGYRIKGFNVRLTPSEMLTITDALRMLRNDADTHPNDRRAAEAMLKEIRKRVLE